MICLIKSSCSDLLDKFRNLHDNTGIAAQVIGCALAAAAAGCSCQSEDFTARTFSMVAGGGALLYWVANRLRMQREKAPIVTLMALKASAEEAVREDQPALEPNAAELPEASKTEAPIEPPLQPSTEEVLRADTPATDIDVEDPPEAQIEQVYKVIEFSLERPPALRAAKPEQSSKVKNTIDLETQRLISESIETSHGDLNKARLVVMGDTHTDEGHEIAQRRIIDAYADDGDILLLESTSISPANPFASYTDRLNVLSWDDSELKIKGRHAVNVYQSCQKQLEKEHLPDSVRMDLENLKKRAIRCFLNFIPKRDVKMRAKISKLLQENPHRKTFLVAGGLHVSKNIATFMALADSFIAIFRKGKETMTVDEYIQQVASSVERPPLKFAKDSDIYEFIIEKNRLIDALERDVPLSDIERYLSVWSATAVPPCSNPKLNCPDELNKFVGSYHPAQATDPSIKPFQISKGSLQLSIGEKTFTLEPGLPGQFFVKGSPGDTLHFSFDETGNVTKIQQLHSGKIECEAVPQAQGSPANDPDCRFIGSYISTDGSGKPFQISKGSLQVSMGEDTLAIEPELPGQFFVKGIPETTFHFSLDEAGKVAKIQIRRWGALLGEAVPQAQAS